MTTTASNFTSIAAMTRAQSDLDPTFAAPPIDLPEVVDNFNEDLAIPPATTHRGTLHLLSARGTFQREQLKPPTDVDDVSTKRYYDLEELNAVWDEMNEGDSILPYRLYLLQGATREHRALVNPTVFFGDRRIIYSSGRDFIKFDLVGQVFLGPLGIMSNVFIRLLETFFDKHALGKQDTVRPLTLREDQNTFSVYLHQMRIEPPTVDSHEVQFVLSFLADPQTFYNNESVVYTDIKLNTLPDCSKDKWEFAETYRAPYDEDSAAIIQENLGTPASDMFSANLSNKIGAFASGNGNVGVTAGALIAAENATSGSKPKPDTGQTGFISKLIGGTVQIAASYAQAKATDAVNKVASKARMAVSDLVPGGSTLGNSIGGYIGGMVGGGINQVGGNIISDILYGKGENLNKIEGFAIGEVVDLDTVDINPREGTAPGLDWLHAYYTGKLGQPLCKGVGRTAAQPVSVPSPAVAQTTDNLRKIVSLVGNSDTSATFNGVGNSLQELNLDTPRIQASLESSRKVSDEIADKRISVSKTLTQLSLSSIAAPSIPGGLAGQATSLLTGLVDSIPGVGGLTSSIGGLLDSATGALGSVTDAVSGAVSGAVGAVSGAVSGVVGGVTGAVSETVAKATGSITSGVKDLAPDIPKLPNG